MTTYKPDILFLQEIDKAKYNSFWVPICNKLGLEAHFSTYPDKHHGLVIAYKAKYFALKEKKEIFYDGLPTASDGTSSLVPMNSLLTKNTGVIVALEIKKDETCTHETNNEGIVIATTHLYWHPFGSFVRAIQCGQLIRQTMLFTQTEYARWPILLGGDFNSSPDDLPYQFLMTQPTNTSILNRTAREIAEKSLQYLCSRYGAEKEQQEPDTFKMAEIVTKVDDEGHVVGIDSKYVDKCIESVIPFYWLGGTSEVSEHRYRVESVYGEHYRKVDPANSTTHNPEFHEPEFSNWAHAWRGLLDYIFLIENIDAVKSDLRRKVVVKELLKMPTGEEMGDAGQPRVGEYPSDHLCLMATVEI